jgi:putative ATP-binding cassette transporter
LKGLPGTGPSPESAQALHPIFAAAGDNHSDNLVPTAHGVDRHDAALDVRLAIAAALLKGRPICVFDEPAAGQDLAFGRRLYEAQLQRFRADGRTLIVVSHDDRWFRVADRVLAMRDGGADNADGLTRRATARRDLKYPPPPPPGNWRI